MKRKTSGPRTRPRLKTKKREGRPTRRKARAASRAGDRLDIRDLPSGDIDALRAELEKSLPSGASARWNANPEDVQRSVAKLVLTLMEFLRKLLERQAIRRMESNTLTEAEVEAVGLALMRLEETLKTMAERFGLAPEDLNLDLGPLGRLI
jgi:hypothetical protein